MLWGVRWVLKAAMGLPNVYTPPWTEEAQAPGVLANDCPAAKDLGPLVPHSWRPLDGRCVGRPLSGCTPAPSKYRSSCARWRRAWGEEEEDVVGPPAKFAEGADEPSMAS